MTTAQTKTARTEAGIPGLRVPDSTLGFLANGYLFGLRRFALVGADAFRTRIAGLPVTVAYGADAARMFYEGDRFGRDRAMPTSVQHLLQDEGSVQTLDGDAHRRRKMMFLRMLSTEQGLEELRTTFAQELLDAAAGWAGPVVLHDELCRVLTRTALRWTGIPTGEAQVDGLTSELAGMVENAGRFGPANWVARLRRRRTEAWARGMVEAARSGRFAEGSPVVQLALHTDADGRLLSADDAAIELLNVLRPTVAVARFIVFAALALHRHPIWRERFAAGDEQELLSFVHEVRRFYPFFPVIGGRALKPFTWHDTPFERGDWVMLDLYATNHDERIWSEPRRFTPERFRTWNGDRNALIPQGAGEPEAGHRCPGEQATVDLIGEAVRVLSQRLSYRVPDQDLRTSLRRFPALPQSGFVIDGVVRRA